MPKDLINRLADFIGVFDCRVYTDGRLMLFEEPPPSRSNRRKGRHVGTVSEGHTGWKIESLTDDAPDYLKPMVGESFNSANMLRCGVRKAALLGEVRKELKGLLGNL